MIRAVLAVLLAVALLGVSLPVLDDAREERSETLVESELDGIETAAVDLASTEEAVELDELERADDGDQRERTVDGGEATGTTGHHTASRRSLSVAVPGRTLTEAPAEYVAIGGIPSADRSGDDFGSDDDLHRDASVLAYRLVGGDVEVRQTTVEFRGGNANGTISPEGDPLVLRGDSELVLSLIELDGDRVVHVRRRG